MNGDPLPLGDLIRPPTLCQTFAAMPQVVTGRNRLQPALPLQTTIPWICGYLNTVNGWGWINHESAVYPDAAAMIARDVWTVSASNGQLHLTAMPTPAAMLQDIPAGLPTDYVSGAIISYPHCQQYGVFELRARLPAGQGLWPGFWLLPQNNTWPPEIDIMEVLGHDTRTDYVSIHSKTQATSTVAARVADMADGFHTFTLDWGPTEVKWYFDRLEIRRAPTPADWHIPMYILVNLAVGSASCWPGAPDATTKFPATMDIVSIKVWKRASYSVS